MGPIFLHAHNKTSQNFYVFRPFDDIMTTQYDHPRYVKHVLAHIYVVYTLFIPYFGCVLLGIDSLRGGLAEGNRIFETGFYDIVTTQNDHPMYVKHVLGRIYVFLTLFGYQVRGGVGGVPRGLVHNLLVQFFTPDTSKIEVFETCFFDVVTT